MSDQDKLIEIVKVIESLKRSLEWHKNRTQLMAKMQSKMRDPERTLVCDILANGQLLPDPEGKRYGTPTTGKEHYQ